MFKKEFVLPFLWSWFLGFLDFGCLFLENDMLLAWLFIALPCTCLFSLIFNHIIPTPQS